MFKMWMMHSFAAQHCFKPFWAYSSRVGIFCPQTTCGFTNKNLKGVTDSPTNVLESLSFHLIYIPCRRFREFSIQP